MEVDPSFDLESVLKRHGLKEIDLSRVLNVSMVTVRWWRRGVRRPSPEHCFLAESKLRIPRHELRPDLWPAPKRERAAACRT